MIDVEFAMNFVRNAPASATECERALADEVERLLAVQEEILMSRKIANDEVERLRAEVDRLTRDRDRLAGYVRAARQLSSDAHKHLLEERPEETAQAIYRVICALASAEKEGDDR